MWLRRRIVLIDLSKKVSNSTQVVIAKLADRDLQFNVPLGMAALPAPSRAMVRFMCSRGKCAKLDCSLGYGKVVRALSAPSGIPSRAKA